MTFLGSQNKDAQFAKVLVGIASEMFSFAPGEILELRAGAGRWPEPIRGWLETPGNEPVAVRLPEGPPAWSNVKTALIDPATFRTVPPPPQPRIPKLTRNEVMAFAGLDENSFAVALTMGFPSAAGQVFTLVNGESRYEPSLERVPRRTVADT